MNATDPLRLRLTLAIAGALGGWFFWLLLDYLPDVIPNQRTLLLLSALTGGFFVTILTIGGQISLRRTVAAATGLSLVSAGLLYWGSFRFDEAGQYLESVHPFAAYFLLFWLPLPFVLAHETSAGGWLDYDALFDHAWSIFVRVTTGWSFVGLFWAVLFLSDQLLQLVGFSYLGDVIEHAWFSATLTGLVFGLAQAVLYEIGTVVSTLRRLALQLFRLLLPPVAAVMILFVLLLPIQGLGKVFGSFSAASTMLIMALGAVTLIAAALDGNDDSAARSRIMVGSAKALALLLPLVTGIAVYAIWLRVAQYGWTPTRLAGSAAALIVLAYALLYALSVLSRANWRQNMRRANIALALGTIGLSVIWLTPVLNVERISANDQVARFKDGTTKTADLDLWRLGIDWGRAGADAMADIRSLTGRKDQKELDALIARFDSSTDRWDFRQSGREENDAKYKTSLVQSLTIVPTGVTAPAAMLDLIIDFTPDSLLESCEKPFADNVPGCVLVLMDDDIGSQGPTGYLIWRGGTDQSADIAVVEPEQNDDYVGFPQLLGGDLRRQSAAETIAKIMDGDYAFTQVRQKALEINGIQILPNR